LNPGKGVRFSKSALLVELIYERKIRGGEILRKQSKSNSIK